MTTLLKIIIAFEIAVLLIQCAIIVLLGKRNKRLLEELNEAKRENGRLNFEIDKQKRIADQNKLHFGISGTVGSRDAHGRITKFDLLSVDLCNPITPMAYYNDVGIEIDYSKIPRQPFNLERLKISQEHFDSLYNNKPNNTTDEIQGTERNKTV